MAKPKKFLVPFTKQGALLHYADEREHAWYRRNAEEHDEPLPRWIADIEWKENTPFYKTLYIDGHQRGRSAAYFIWKDTSNNEFPMFMTDITDLIRGGRVEYGIVSGWWNVAKRGQNYGVRFISEKEPREIREDT